MESEVTSVYDDAIAWIRERPLISIGGTLALGLLVGFLIRGRRNRGKELTELQSRLVRHYLEAMEDRIERAIGEGLSRREAIQEALEDGVPLIIYQGDGERTEKDSGGGGSTLSFMLKTMFGFVLREVAEEFVHNLVVGATSAQEKTEDQSKAQQ